MFEFRISAVCGVGLRRLNNEDNLCVNGIFMDKETAEKTKEEIFTVDTTCSDSLIAAVCDGMGGEAAGENASFLGASTLAKIELPTDEETVFASLREANKLLEEEAKRLDAMRIGSTAAILTVSGNQATVINVGDSRVYRMRKRKLEQLSHDQSEVQSFVDAGIISAKKARTHPMRHRILKFLGMPDDMLEFEAAKKFDVVSGDIFLICSDGLTECVEDKKIASILKSKLDAKALYDEAMKNGGVDNTTVIVVEVK